MDNNLYYLQSLGVSGMTFSANTLTLTNPTGGIIANALIDINADSRWYIPSGSTVEIGSYSQSFVYGDLYVLGELILNDNSQLIILNGNLILSGGTITVSGSGQTVLVDLPTFGDLITSGTYSGGTLTLSTSNGTDVTVNGFFTGSTDVFTTGASYNNGIIYFDTNVSPSAYTVNISSLTGGSNTFLTGVTYDNLTNTITLTDNTNTTFNAYIDSVSGLTVNGSLSATTLYGDGSNLTGIPTQDTFVTGGTYSNGSAIFTNNTGGTFNVSGFYTGLTDNNQFTTGFTYSSNTFTILDNSGNTFNATINTVTGLTVNGGLSATTISATTYQNLPLSGYGTGLTFNTANYNLTIDGGNGVLDTVSLSVLASDLTVTGGTYNPNTGIAVFTNNTGGTFNVTGFLTGLTDTYVSGSTYSNNTFTFTNTSGGSFNVNFNTVTGLTSTGTISSNTISATTYQNLPTDVRVTGGTYSAGTTTFTNNTGGTFSITGFSTGYTYSQTNNYTSGIPVSITHNFGTTEVLVQIIDTNTNQQIFGNISNYQLNSFDVTLNSSLNGIKVVVAGGSLTSTTPRGSITLLFGHDSVSPSDSVSYFIGGQFNLAPLTSTNDGRRLITQKTGNITQVSISRTIGGTLGSSELNTLSINNVTQATTRIITSAATFDSSSSLINYTLTSPLPVVAGDKLEIEWDTPSYATNPTTVRQQINVLIDF
jgi:hypothetical protein